LRLDASLRDALIAQVEALTAAWPPSGTTRALAVPQVRSGVAKEQIARFKQQALMICFPAPAGQTDDARIHVLNNILSGDNSRIYWEVIQQGLCPQAGAFYLDYSDVGVFVLYALCEPQRVDAVPQRAPRTGQSDQRYWADRL